MLKFVYIEQNNSWRTDSNWSIVGHDTIDFRSLAEGSYFMYAHENIWVADQVLPSALSDHGCTVLRFNDLSICSYGQ